MSDTGSRRRQARDRETLPFGERVCLDNTALYVDGEPIALNTIKPVRLDDSGQLVITRIGATEPLLTLPTADLEDAGALLEMVNARVAEVPYLERRSVTGWPPGSVGDVSARIGYDVRELWMAGYSAAEIDSVVYGDRTVGDLLKHEPGDRPASSQASRWTRSEND